MHRQRLGDLDHLLLGERQPADGRRRAEAGAEALQERRHHLALLGGVDDVEQPAGARLAADIDVGGNVEIVEEVELLVHEGDAGAHRRGDAQRAFLDAIDGDGAGIGGDDAAQDLHQSGFAGAVLADEADDLAGCHAHRKALQRENAGIGLADARKDEERLGRSRRGSGSSAGHLSSRLGPRDAGDKHGVPAARREDRVRPLLGGRTSALTCPTSP